MHLEPDPYQLKWSRRARIWVWIALGLTGLFLWIAGTDALPWLRGPGPYPPEWRWLYAPLGWDRPWRNGVHLALLCAYVVTALLTAWPQPGDGTTQGRTRRFAWGVGMAALFLVVWQLAQVWLREQSLLDQLVFRTYAPPLNGDFVAPAPVGSVWENRNH